MALSFTLRKPLSAIPLLDVGDSLNRGQVGWWLANEGAGARVTNVANPNLYNGALQSGVTWAKQTAGNTLAFDGTATSYVDLGTAPLLASNTQPFTLSWIENVGASPPAFAALATFLPAGSAQRWLLLRDDSNANYQFLSWGMGGTAAVIRAATAPSLASSVGVVRHFLLYSPGGMASTTPSNWFLFIDGNGYPLSNGFGLGTQPANLNYFGWDGADSKWKGNLEMRLWNRLLSNDELNRVLTNPYAGSRNHQFRSILAPTPVTALFNRMFLAM